MSKSIYYGDQFRWWVGKVAETTEKDPTKTGRVKVRIFGLHDSASIRNGDLPWAQVSMPNDQGGGSGLLEVSTLQPQTLVFGMFLDGANSQSPLVLGILPTREAFVAETYRESRVSNEIDEVNIRSRAQEEEQSGFGFDPVGGEKNDNYIADNVVNLQGQDNLERAWYWFSSEKGGGYSPEAVAGLLGNFWIESGPNAGRFPDDIDPEARNKSDEQSFGIAQWNPINGGNREYINPKSRLADLIRWAADMGLPKGDLFAQLTFVTWELENQNIHACSAELHEAGTPEQAARIVEVKYEMPEFYKEPTHPKSSSFRRREAARVIFKRFTGTD